VLPSISERTGSKEGRGLVLVEAQASALPVIGTKSGGISEARSPDVCGLLVPGRDERGLREAIRRLSLSAEERSAMGRAGRKFVEDRFDQGRLNARLLQLLWEIRARQ
jgi:glycosyltransferase involved in cell wall biosynthesis